MAPPRIVFMGTPAFAVSSLEACLELGQVVGVVTQPDKPRGRGNEVSFSPVKERALAAGIPVLQPVKIRNPGQPAAALFASELAALQPEVCVVTAYGKILPKDVLEVAPHGCVNVHASLLPRFRGAAPIQWAIASGDGVTGVCLMKMDEGMDTGPVIARREEKILPTDTSQELFVRLAALGGEILKTELIPYLRGERVPQPQPATGVVMAPMIKKEDGRLDFTRPAVELERRLRAFLPWPGAYTQFGGGLLKVHWASVVEGEGAPGEVLAAEAEGITVACGAQALRLESLQPEGKRAMGAGEFLAGRKVAVGSRPFGGHPPPDSPVA
jgi:methionyl-tRNA formyltransferase